MYLAGCMVRDPELIPRAYMLLCMLVGRLYPLKFITSRSIVDISVGKLVGGCVCVEGGGVSDNDLT